MWSFVVSGVWKDGESIKEQLNICLDVHIKACSYCISSAAIVNTKTQTHCKALEGLNSETKSTSLTVLSSLFQSDAIVKEIKTSI